MQDKQLELEIIEYELELVIESKIMLIKLLSKKGRSDEHSKILAESLKQSRSREQELLNQRNKIQKTISNGGNTKHSGITQDNETKI